MPALQAGGREFKSHMLHAPTGDCGKTFPALPEPVITGRLYYAEAEGGVKAHAA